ncbi:MAG: dTMP kinase [Clostridiales bacterium]|nr:dTMP kinase [Clostridiales bacterium]
MVKEQGFFITFEGVDGCGKTLMAGKLAAYLREAGCFVLSSREPGGSALGAEIRRLVLHREESIDPRTETLLFAADRAQHVASLIWPALERGEVVVCDRFTDSTIAYQGSRSGFVISDLEWINNFATASLRPDLTFYLRVPLGVAFRRRGTQSDRLEREGRAFLSV